MKTIPSLRWEGTSWNVRAVAKRDKDAFVADHIPDATDKQRKQASQPCMINAQSLWLPPMLLHRLKLKSQQPQRRWLRKSSCEFKCK